LVEETCHWFDLARWIMDDEVATVSCQGVSDIHRDFNFEDLVFVQGRYRSGGVFQISHALTGFDFSLVLQVHGTAGTAWCGLKEAASSSLDAGQTRYLGVVSTAPLNASPQDASVFEFGVEATEPFNIAACTAAAVDTLRTGEPWTASLQDGVESLRIALAARQSLDTGNEVSLWHANP
jgi:predicted dehydrogenase